MKGLGAVSRLELERDWMLLPLALAVGFVPFAVMPLLGAPFVETNGLAKVLALLLVLATALLLGATAVPSDLATGRLGFYFARPLPWWAIWGGKLATALGLTLAAGFLVLLPSLLFGNLEMPSLPPRAFQGIAVLLANGLGLVVVAIALAHWGAVAVRARSPWIALDLVALPLVAWAANDAGRRILEQGYVPLASGFAALVWPVAAALLVAGAVQVAEGRTSARRSHAAASLVGWALLALLVSGWQVFSRTGFEQDPDRLEYAWVLRAAPSGSTGVFVGAARVPGFSSFGGGRDAFLTSPQGVRPIEYASRAFAFSGDSTQAVWLCDRPGGFELCRLELSSGRTSAVALRPPPSSHVPARLLADEHAGRVAVLQQQGASLYDAASGERLASLPDALGGRVEYVLFLPGAELVYRAAPDGGLAIEEITRAGSAPSGHVDPPGDGTWLGLHFDVAGERLLATARGEARLVDARTGEALAAFDGSPRTPLEGLLLSDGRVLTAAAGTPLRLYEASGSLVGEVDLGRGSAWSLLETRPGRVIATVFDPGSARRTPEGADDGALRLAVVDVEPFRVVRIENGLRRQGGLGPGLAAGQDRPAGSVVLVDRLGSDPYLRSSLLRYDVETGAREWVAGGR